MLAAGTDAINLGTSIVNVWGRDAQAARMSAMTLAEASGGRFVLGLGVSHPHLAAKLRGHDFARPLTRMREYLAAYRAAVYRGPIAEGWPDPPVLVAALRERMTDLAATEADGALPYLFTPERVAWMRGRLDAASGEGRPILAVTLPVVIGDPAEREAARAYLRPYLRTPTYHGLVAAPGIRAGGLGAAGQRPARRRDGGDRDGRRRSRPHRGHAGRRRRSRCDHPRRRRRHDGVPADSRSAGARMTRSVSVRLLLVLVVPIAACSSSGPAAPVRCVDPRLGAPSPQRRVRRRWPRAVDPGAAHAARTAADGRALRHATRRRPLRRPRPGRPAGRRCHALAVLDRSYALAPDDVPPDLVRRVRRPASTVRRARGSSATS